MRYADFSAFIKAKGFEALANLLGKELGTIYSYASRNRIPRERWPELLIAYPDLGMNDLLEMEKASPARQQA